MDPREQLIEAIEAHALDPDADTERRLAEALAAAADDPEAADAARVARAILHGPTPAIPPEARADLLYHVAVQEVEGNHDPELAPLFRWIAEHEPEYAAMRDAVRQADADHAAQVAAHEPLDAELVRAWALGALPEAMTTRLCERVEAADPTVVEPVAALLRDEPHLVDTADLLAEEPVRLHRWRLARALGQVAREARVLAAADSGIPLVVEFAGEAVYACDLDPVEGEPLLGGDRKLTLDIGPAPGAETWAGRTATLHLAAGEQVVARGTVDDSGLVALEAVGVLADMARLLPAGAVDLRTLVPARKGDWRLRLRVR